METDEAARKIDNIFQASPSVSKKKINVHLNDVLKNDIRLNEFHIYLESSVLYGKL